MAPDEITLTVPRDRSFHGVAHLVLGGLGARLNLTLETLEDVQVALTGLLDRAAASNVVTMRVRILDDGLEAELGPFDGAVLESDLARGEQKGLGLRRILETVVDELNVDTREDGAWVVVRKVRAE